MFGLDSSELVVIAVVALLVIGPKDLPRVMRMVGQWVGKARTMSRHVRSGFDTMMREAELEEMQKQWDAQNAAIMAATQLQLDTPEAYAAVDEAKTAEAAVDEAKTAEAAVDEAKTAEAAVEADPPSDPGIDVPASRAA